MSKLNLICTLLYLKKSPSLNRIRHIFLEHYITNKQTRTQTKNLFITKRRHLLVLIQSYKLILKYLIKKTNNLPLFAELGGVRGAGQHQCERCAARYSHKRNLWRHERYECGQPPKFQCPYCSVRTKQKVNMRKHMATCRANSWLKNS